MARKRAPPKRSTPPSRWVPRQEGADIWPRPRTRFLPDHGGSWLYSGVQDTPLPLKAAAAMADFAATADQRPAAYRFTLRDGKIDVLAEVPEPEDRAFALDTYNELVAKTRELCDRLE